jgi:hypothetical protein
MLHFVRVRNTWQVVPIFTGQSSYRLQAISCVEMEKHFGISAQQWTSTDKHDTYGTLCYCHSSVVTICTASHKSCFLPTQCTYVALRANSDYFQSKVRGLESLARPLWEPQISHFATFLLGRTQHCHFVDWGFVIPEVLIWSKFDHLLT